MRIRHKLSMVVSALVISSLTILSLVAYNFTKNTMIESNTDLIESTATIQSNEIESFLTDSLSKVQGYSNLKGLINADPEEGVQELSRVYPTLADDFANISFANLEGTRWNYKGEEGSVADRAYFTQTISEKKGVISDVLISNTTDEPAVIVTSPILDKEIVNGIGYATLELDRLQTVISESEIGETGFGFMTDQNGMILAHGKEPELLAQVITEDGFSEDNPMRYIWDNKDGETDSEFTKLEHDIDGEKYLTTLVPVNVMGNSPWYLGVSVEKAEIEQNISRLQLIFIVLSAVSIIVTTFVTWIFSKRFVAPIEQMSQVTQRVAEGDLTASNLEINSSDEIGELYQNIVLMTDNLRGFVQSIDITANQVAVSAEDLTRNTDQSSKTAAEVTSAVNDIARGTSEQANNMSVGSMNMNNLGDLIVKEQAYIVDLNDAATNTETLRNEGFELIAELVKVTADNNQSISVINEVITETNESAQEIEKASAMIGNIADQTNLLALNAAIEAARAGESGRGFSVVANEIRVLAEDSNRFTTIIENVIKELTEKTELAVSTIKDVENMATLQSRSVDTTSNKFTGIAKEIERMQDIIGTVTTLGKDMEQNKDETIRNIENLSAISEETAAGTEEVSASVEEQASAIFAIEDNAKVLEDLSEEMKNAVAKFDY